MVGATIVDMSDTAGFLIHVVNTGTVEDTISSLEFFDTPESAYMRDFHIDGNLGIGYPKMTGEAGAGPGDTVNFAPVTVAPNMSQMVELFFAHFYVDSPGVDTTTNVPGKEFRFRFSEGSDIEFVVPSP